MLICAAVIGVATAAFTVPRHSVAKVGVGFNPSSVSVRVGETLEQLVAVKAWGLYAVNLRLAPAVSKWSRRGNLSDD